MSASRSRVNDPEKVIKETFREAEYADGWAEAVLADYRHELAEKIRDRATEDWRCCGQSLRMAADLIDPQKEGQ